MSPIAGLLELWLLEVLIRRSHGEVGSKEKGHGVGIEEWGGVSWGVWEAERPGGRLKEAAPV